MRTTLILVLLCTVVTFSFGQQSAHISIVHDDNRGTNEFLNLVKEEINILLSQRYTISYNDISIGNSNQSTIAIIQEAINDDSDVLITFGFNASGALSALGTYPKPCIAGISIERRNQESTGVDNFTLIQSPFNIKRDFEVFQSIYPFKQLGIFIPADAPVGLEVFLKRFANGFDIQFIPITDNPSNDLNQLNSEIDAIYFLPNLYENLGNQQALIDGVNERKLPSFSLIGRDDVEQGILASISPSDYVGGVCKAYCAQCNENSRRSKS